MLVIYISEYIISAVVFLKTYFMFTDIMQQSLLMVKLVVEKRTQWVRGLNFLEQLHHTFKLTQGNKLELYHGRYISYFRQVFGSWKLQRLLKYLILYYSLFPFTDIDLYSYRVLQPGKNKQRRSEHHLQNSRYRHIYWIQIKY